MWPEVEVVQTQEVVRHVPRVEVVDVPYPSPLGRVGSEALLHYELKVGRFSVFCMVLLPGYAITCEIL